MHILVINSGSSSLKYELFDMTKHISLTTGIIEEIGLKGGAATHKAALELVFDMLSSKNYKLNSISAIGHRVVHGGEYFHQAVKIDAKVIEKIKKCSILAPLHNPANLAGILACQEMLPKIPQVAVFDTAFHQSMKLEHYLYPLPYDYYSKHKIRRYGFHGTSHKYVYQRLLQMLSAKGGMVSKKNLTLKTQNLKLKIITCHIGNGASITAIQNSKVIETSMGMTPLEGLMMGTRCGNIDPAIVTYLIRHEKFSPAQVEEILEKKSGLLGVSGVSSDMRDILAGVKKGHKRCQLALDMYLNSIVKYIGAYTSLMGGVDVIVLTAGMMERSKIVRKMLMQRLARLGIKLDEKKNNFDTKEVVISTPTSKVKVIVIPTDEEANIARETQKILSTKQK